MLYSSGRRNTHFETKRSGGNDVHRLVLSCFVRHSATPFSRYVLRHPPLNVIEISFYLVTSKPQEGWSGQPNIVLSIPRCVSLQVVFDFSSF